MTTTKKIIIAMASLVTSTLFAQTCGTCTWFPKGDEAGQGVVGKRYAEAGVFFTDIRHTSHELYGAGLSANVPILKNVEVSGGYEYGTFNFPTESWYGNTHIHYHTVGGSVTFFNEIEDGIKPFVSVSLNRSLQDSSGDMKNFFKDNHTNWGVTVGAEFPFKWFAAEPFVGYSDDFEASSRSYQAWTFGLEVNSWLTRRIGTFATVAYSDNLHTSVDTWRADFGIRVRF